MHEEDQEFKNKIEDELQQLKLKIDYIDLSNKANMKTIPPKKENKIEEGSATFKE